MDKPKMSLTKKGMVSGTAIVTVIVTLLVAFILVANLLPVAQTQGQAINAAGLPLGTLFGSTGIIWTLVMVAVFVGVIGLLGLYKKGRR